MKDQELRKAEETMTREQEPKPEPDMKEPVTDKNQSPPKGPKRPREPETEDTHEKTGNSKSPRLQKEGEPRLKEQSRVGKAIEAPR